MYSNDAETGVLVDPDWVSERLGDPNVRLVEVDVSRASYDGGHVPGAVLWNAYEDLRHPDYDPVGAIELERVLSRSGVASDTTVVFYGYAAHLGFWLLRAHGHERVRLLDGTRDRWERTGHGWSTDVPAPAPTAYTLPVSRSEVPPSAEAVRAMIRRPDELILDVRSQAEYDGERFWPSGATEGAGRAGHIPGAVHLPIELLRGEAGSFKSTTKMRQILRDRQVAPDRRVVAYCTIGNRASQAWFALRYLLGYPQATVYYGSWAEWGSRDDSPIDR